MQMQISEENGIWHTFYLWTKQSTAPLSFDLRVRTWKKNKPKKKKLSDVLEMSHSDFPIFAFYLGLTQTIPKIKRK